MSIQERQNQQDSIEKLAAQRIAYSRAKITRNLGLALVLLVAILGIVASAVENQGLHQFVPLIALISWFFDQQVLKSKESALKTEAATIQEDFDCFVLCLPWPGFKGIQRPARERVRQLAKKAASKPNGLEEFKDWYSPDAIPQDPLLSRIHCQKINSWWDASLRRNWKTFLIVACWISAILALGMCVYTGISVANHLSLLLPQMFASSLGD